MAWKLIVGDKCMGMLEAVGEVFPDTKYQRCTVHFYRNVFFCCFKSKLWRKCSRRSMPRRAKKHPARRQRSPPSRAMKLKEAAKKVEDGIEETLTYCDFPSEH